MLLINWQQASYKFPRMSTHQCQKLIIAPGPYASTLITLMADFMGDLVSDQDKENVSLIRNGASKPTGVIQSADWKTAWASFHPPPKRWGPWPKSTVICQKLFRGYHQ